MPEYRDYQPNLRFLPTLVTAPDGSFIAYVDDANGQFNIAIQPTAGGAVRRLTDYTDSSVRRVAWHPGGAWLLFLADRQGDENAQLYRLEIDSGKVTPLTSEPGVQYAAAIGDPFSPDGKQLAYCGNDRLPGDQDILVRDLESDQVRRLYTGGGRVFAGSWSPTGDRLTITEWRATNSDHLVRVLDLRDGSARLLTPTDGESVYYLGPWLPDGSGFLVLSNAGREFTGLAVMNADSGELTWLDTPDWDIHDVVLSADGRTLAWSVNADGFTEFRVRNLITGEDLTVPNLPGGAATGLTISPDAGHLILRMSTPSRPWNIATIELATATLRWLTDVRPVAADPARFTDASLIRYPARDGLQIPAFLYRPAGVDRPRGVLISVHGGPAWQESPSYMYDGFYQYLLEHGVAVLAPNFRGSIGYGRAYAELVHRDWGGGDLTDLADAVTYLRTQDWVEPDRIGVMGASYGGFAVLSSLSRLPELNWAAGVDFYGPSNLVTLAKASPPTWRSLVAAMIGDPEADADRLMARSPVSHADKIVAPLMIIQGANDPRVPQSESDQIVELLRRNGVEVRYEIFGDEGHGFTRRENQAKAFADAGRFLIEHLTK